MAKPTVKIYPPPTPQSRVELRMDYTDAVNLRNTLNVTEGDWSGELWVVLRDAILDYEGRVARRDSGL